MPENKTITEYLKEFCQEHSIDDPSYTCGREGSGDYFVKAQVYQISIQTFGKTAEVAKSKADANLLVKLQCLQNSDDKQSYEVHESMLKTQLIETFQDACTKRGSLWPEFKVTEIKAPFINGSVYQVSCALGSKETVGTAMKIEDALEKATFKMIIDFPT